MSGRVLVLGGGGFVGRVLGRRLAAAGWQPVLASRRPGRAEPGVQTLGLDACKPDALQAALTQADAVVNCVAGGADTIAGGARLLAGLLTQSPGSVAAVVHLSSMAVYGGVEGRVDETTPYGSMLGWYGDAKVAAERELMALAPRLPITVLRPGCIYGPGSDQWTGRVGRLLQAGRIGDLGALGDGWSNLVHVEDVAAAVLAALGRDGAGGAARVYNLAAPDSPRWNDYFTGLARGLGLTPLRRVSARQLKLDAKLFSVGLKLAMVLAGKARLDLSRWPDPLPPSLLRLWQQQIHLDAQAASRELGLQWRRFDAGLQDSVEWLKAAGARTH